MPLSQWAAILAALSIWWAHPSISFLEGSPGTSAWKCRTYGIHCPTSCCFDGGTIAQSGDYSAEEIAPPPKVSAMVGQPGRWELPAADRETPAVVIYQNHVGAFQITIDPDYRYQWARMSGAGARHGTTVTQEFHELSRTRLDQPADSAGWRNPLRIDRYIVPVTQFTGRLLPDGQTFVDVRTDAADHFLIVITQLVLKTEDSKGDSRDQRSDPHPNQ